MKRFPLALLLLATIWSPGVATGGLTAATAGELADAARAAKAKRKKPASRVITNEDVKKSKGTLIVLPSLPAMADEGPQPTLAEKHATDKKARAEHEALLAAATLNVATLEKELSALEQKYYDENDLDRRDGDLVKQFNDVAAKLRAARKELAVLTPQVASGTQP